MVLNRKKRIVGVRLSDKLRLMEIRTHSRHRKYGYGRTEAWVLTELQSNSLAEPIMTWRTPTPQRGHLRWYGKQNIRIRKESGGGWNGGPFIGGHESHQRGNPHDDPASPQLDNAGWGNGFFFRSSPAKPQINRTQGPKLWTNRGLCCRMVPFWVEVWHLFTPQKRMVGLLNDLPCTSVTNWYATWRRKCLQGSREMWLTVYPELGEHIHWLNGILSLGNP